MSFKMKYKITNDYLPLGTKRRSGIRIIKVKFVVDHDTGNPNSTARGNVNYYRDSANVMSASAHTFIDDKDIIVCVPLWEKAWHVIYDVVTDNAIYGDDANDIAIGVELCYFPNDKARSIKAYEKYVWYNAWLAYTYKLNIKKDFIGHSKLDPRRKTDPENAFRYIGKTFASFLDDVQKEYDDCTKVEVKPATPTIKYPMSVSDRLGEVKLKSEMNYRRTSEIADNIISVLPNGHKCHYYEIKGDWIRLGQGWVSNKEGKYVEITKVYSKDVEQVSKPHPPVKEAEAKEELEELKLEKWQREELRDIFKDARAKGIFTSADHEKTIMDGTMTLSYLVYLQSVIAAAALNGGKRVE